jgi:phospholipase/lecithinase/hemolysin
MAQVNDYLISKHFNLTAVSHETQYIFLGGSNDVLNLLSNTTLTAQGVNGDAANLVVGIPALITLQTQKLIQAGATNILVILLPSWSFSPVGKVLFSSAQLEVLSQFTNSLNDAIKSNVSALARPGITLKFFDTISFFQRLINRPEDFGLINVTSPCLENHEVFINGTGGQEPIICSNPDEFLFWDVEHPTAKVHAVFGSEVMRFLGWGQC